jgi:hypothetical protein
MVLNRSFRVWILWSTLQLIAISTILFLACRTEAGMSPSTIAVSCCNKHTHTHTPDSSFAYVHHLRVSLSQTLCSCQHHWQAIAGHVQRVRDGQANPGINRRGYWRRQVPSWYFANAQVGFWQNGMYCQSTQSHFAPFTTMTRLMVDLSLAIVYPYRFTCP